MNRNASKNRIDPRHVDVLDGIRALAIGLVLWFHVWQQSWLPPYWHVPQWLVNMGVSSTVSFDFLPRSGFLWVDMMLLISAFCLFLPHARAAMDAEPVPRAADFYKKRLIRIVPCYCLSVLIIFFLFALPGGAYASARECWPDLLSTLTFTQTFFPNVLLGTKLNGVLWTAAIEMQFYLIFPLLARCFRKRPVWTYLGMIAVSVLYLNVFALGDPDRLRVTVNQLPGFFGVFANGMLLAYGYIRLSKALRRSGGLSALATLGALVSIGWIVWLLLDATRANPVQVWQASHRFALSIAFSLFILCSALAARGYRLLFSNRVATFFAGISYNVYIWHQWLAVKFKQWRIPYWEGEQAPNFTGDRAWQWLYTVLVILTTVVLSTLLTHLFERPVSRRLQTCHCPTAIKLAVKRARNALFTDE